ncbi:MAG: acetate kinase [Paludibacteraceae bacterium]|nr:acetate kinase [Paludibacteraceae bacterium]
MKILVLNCGSSSIKYKLFDMTKNEVLSQGAMEKVGMKGSFLNHTNKEGKKVTLEGEVLEHQIGIEYILGVLTSEAHGCIASLDEINVVGHRVVHGGEKFNSSVLIDEEVIAKMEECIDMAPLHNPPNLAGIYAISDLMPDIPQIGVFDTAFHLTMPDYAYMYAIPYELYVKYSVRRYGFHGTSHRYVSQRAAEFLGLDIKNSKIITCHIGNGCSIAAVKNGESVDTSMGFTPIEGLMMGTRSGDIGLGAVFHIMDKEMIGTASASTLFNKHSGMIGITGVSSDMREVTKASEEGNERAKLGLQMYAYRIKKYIGSYMAALGGADAVIFTGGVGENSDKVRAMVCENMEFLGIDFDAEKNKQVKGEESVLSKAGSKVKIAVVPTNEEFMIASDALRIVSEMRKK